MNASRKLTALALAIGATSSLASAATITWSSHDVAVDPSDNAIWSNPLNWVGGVAPVAGDDVVIGIPVANGNRVTSNDLPAGTQINGIRITANLNQVNGNLINLGGDVAYTAGGSSVGNFGAPVVLLQDTTYSVSANTSNGRLEVSGGISGAFDLTKADAGRLRLVGTAKTYTGDTIVTGGLLDLSANDMLPFGAGKGDVYIGTGAQLFLNNVNTQINGLNDHAGSAGAVNKSGSNTRSLTLGNGDANGSFSGAITFTGGSSTVNKVGAGTQTLSGAVSVTGAGSVTGGRLNLNGTWSNGVQVNSTGTLGGTGSIAGAVSIGNAGTVGTLSPGVGVGTLTIANALIFSGNGVLQADLSGSDTTVGAGINDLVSGVTDLTLDGALNVTEAVAGSFATAADGSSWRLINYTGVLTNNGLEIGTAPVLPAGGSLSIDTSIAGQVNLVLAIPEPTSLAALAGASLLLVRRRK